MQWLDQRLELFLRRLQDNLLRRASCLAEGDERRSLHEQQANIALNRQAAKQRFLNDIRKAMTSGPRYQAGSTAQLDPLLRTWRHLAREQLEQGLRLLRAISQVAVMARFPKLAGSLEITSSHQNQALTLFNLLVVLELPELYCKLSQRLSRAEPDASLGSWLHHTQTQQQGKTLSSQQRALNQLRAQRLQQKLNARASKPAPLDDDTLLQQVADLFANTRHSSTLNSAARAALNSLQNRCCNVALQDRELFLNPLHPARQVCQQLVESCQALPSVGPEAAEQFTDLLRHTAKRLSAANSSFASVQDEVGSGCQQILASARLNRRRRQRQHKGQENIAKLRRQVHKLIDRKIHNLELLPEIRQLFYGPLTTILIYFWSRHGSNSEPLQRYLKLIDDIIWYTHAHRDWKSMRRAKQLGPSIEKQLQDGFEQINYDQLAAGKFIHKLHQLRYLALNQSHIR